MKYRLQILGRLAKVVTMCFHVGIVSHTSRWRFDGLERRPKMFGKSCPVSEQEGSVFSAIKLAGVTPNKYILGFRLSGNAGSQRVSPRHSLRRPRGDAPHSRIQPARKGGATLGTSVSYPIKCLGDSVLGGKIPTPRCCAGLGGATISRGPSVVPVRVPLISSVLWSSSAQPAAMSPLFGPRTSSAKSAGHLSHNRALRARSVR